MSREWKPGDVALVTYYDCSPKIGLVRPRQEACGDLEFAYVSGGYDPDPVAAVEHWARPLIVIDPEDRAQAGDLLTAWFVSNGLSNPQITELEAERMQAALRTLVEPPKPEEPQGLGAVVEYDGSVWISLGHHRWLELPDDRLIEPRRFHWADFPSDVRKRSDGWAPDAAGGAS